MRRERLFVAAGACLAAVALALGAAGGTAVADPVPAPPPYPPVVGVGAQTTQNLMNDLCNNIIKDASTNRICQSWDNGPQPSTIKTRDGAGVCEIPRPSQGGSGFDSLIANPTCVDFARVVTATDKPARPAGFTYIPMAADTLTYAFRGDGTVPSNLSDATLKKSSNATLRSLSHPIPMASGR
jgi:ABC-type phosphate transport system substrate-binding protein